MSFALSGFEEFGAQDLQGFFFVLSLGSTVLGFDLNTGWEVGNLNCGVGGIDVLSSGATRTSGLYMKFVRLKLNIDFFSFG